MHGQMQIEVGRKLRVFVHHNRIEMMPIEPASALRGFLPGIDTAVQRDADRACIGSIHVIDGGRGRAPHTAPLLKHPSARGMGRVRCSSVHRAIRGRPSCRDLMMLNPKRLAPPHRVVTSNVSAGLTRG